MENPKEILTGNKAFCLRMKSVLQMLLLLLPTCTVTKQMMDQLPMDSDLMTLQWCLRQFSRSASGSNSAAGASSYETSPASKYSAERMSSDAWGIKVPDTRTACGRESTNWRKQQASTKPRSASDEGLPYPNSSASYPSPGRYSSTYPLQSSSSYGNDESVHTCTSSANSAVSGRGSSRWNQDSRWKQESRSQGFRHQKAGYKSELCSPPYSFSGSGSYGAYRHWGSSRRTFDEDTVGLTPSILNGSQGKDIPAMTRICGRRLSLTLHRVNVDSVLSVLQQAAMVTSYSPTD